MTWKAYHNRGDVLRAAIDAAEFRRDGELPMDLHGVIETFRDELDLLAALALKWHTRLAGHIEFALGAQPLDLEEAVIAAWCDTATELGGVRQILDNYREHPVDYAMAGAMLKSTNKERQSLAVNAGKAGFNKLHAEPDPDTVRVGAAIEDKARERYNSIPVIAVPEQVEEPRKRNFIDKLRDALAA